MTWTPAERKSPPSSAKSTSPIRKISGPCCRPQGSDIQVHFGDSDFLARYRSYQQHLPEWRQQYPHLASVDMRYENQVVLDMTQQAGGESGQDAAASQRHSQHHASCSETPGREAGRKIAQSGKSKGLIPRQ